MTVEGKITRDMFLNALPQGSFISFPELFTAFKARLVQMGATDVQASSDPFCIAVSVRASFPDDADLVAELGILGLAPLPKGLGMSPAPPQEES